MIEPLSFGESAAVSEDRSVESVIDVGVVIVHGYFISIVTIKMLGSYNQH